jgi:hypothetical protein
MIARIDDLQNCLFGLQPGIIVPPWTSPGQRQDEDDAPGA